MRDFTYKDAVEYLINSYSSKCKAAFYDVVGNLNSVYDNLKVIHVAGTNGKGTTCVLLANILIKSGYKVGMFTSPHLEVYNERICVNGIPISDNDLAKLIGKVKSLTENAGYIGISMPFFYILTLVAFFYFNEQNVDYVVLEVGIGGRLDSTNVISSPLLSVITKISYDHMDILGDTLSEISYEKAGIIKHNRPVVVYDNSPEALHVIFKKANEMNSKVYYCGNKNIDVKEKNFYGTTFSLTVNGEIIPEVRTKLLGSYQIFNVANCLVVVRALNDLGLNIGKQIALDAIYETKWPGRMEIVRKKPLTVIDGAHNLDGITAVISDMNTLFKEYRKIFVVGILKTKDFVKMINAILEVADVIILTKSENEKSVNTAELMGSVGENRNKKVCFVDRYDLMSSKAENCLAVCCIDNCTEAVDTAIDLGSKDDIIFVTGSLYLVGNVRNHLLKGDK